MADCPLPPYLGSAIRGLLGHGMRRVFCVTRKPQCDSCSLLARCNYTHFFETPAPTAQSSQRFSTAPHPWLLDLDVPSPQKIRVDDSLQFGMTLLGNMGQALPWLVLAFEHAGQIGFGHDHIPFELTDLWHESPTGSQSWKSIAPDALPRLSNKSANVPVTPVMPQRIELHFQTPLRLKRDGQLIRPEALTLSRFLNALRLRLRDLLGLYGLQGEGYSLPDIPAHADAAMVQHSLVWQDWTRWSNRQKTPMKLGGVVGNLELDLAGLESWWPLLWVGQWVHVGKQSSMGLGQYRLLVKE